ncbi:MAG TPA: outer membrane protein transport protein [Isosphaeraceae bacterium]
MARARKGWTRLRGLVGAATLLVAWGGAAHAEDAVEQIGISARAKARGGADVAVGDSPLSQVENPATISLHGHALDSSYQLILPRTRWDSPLDSAYSEFGAIPLFNFAGTHPINDRLSLGAAFFTKSGLAGQYHARHRFFPRQELIEHVDVLNFALPLNLSYKVTERLSLGAGIRAEFSTARLLSVLGPIDANLQRGYAWGGGFQVGALYQVTRDFRLGLGYRSTTWMGDFQGNHLLVTPSPLLTMQPPQTIDVGDARTTARLPQKLNLGASWDVTERLKLSSDVRWINYAESFAGESTVRTRGVPPLAPGLPPLVPREFKLPFGYRDQFVLAVGADRKFTDNLTLSAGYNYASPVLPGRNLYPLSSVLPQHHVTVGANYRRGNWSIGGGYILGVTQGITSGPSALPGNIPPGLLPGPLAGGVRNDFANSFISQTQHSIFLGIGYQY